MASFLERATGLDSGSSEMIDLPFFELCLQLYIGDIATASVFERGELGLTVQQLQELTDLLALMPASPDLRIAWRARVVSVFQGARLYFEPLDSIAKVSTALGL